MLIIPAIDIRGGRCVRLYQGSYEKETVYFEDPLKMAKLWRVMNAHSLHIVDLDAARGGSEHNRAVITAITRALDIPIQLGGGLRTLDDIEAAIGLGVYRVVIGTSAVRDPDLISRAIERFGSSTIAVGIDAHEGEVRVEGWTEGSGLDAVKLAEDMEDRGVRRFVYTDIARDGTLEGPNVLAYRSLGKRLKRAHITASGGVGCYQDLLHIKSLARYKVDSVIVGRALYENKFPCQQFWCWHAKDQVNLDQYSTATLSCK